MRIEGSVAPATAANRGPGQAFAHLLLDHGAAKVYGAAREPGAVTADLATLSPSVAAG